MASGRMNRNVVCLLVLGAICGAIPRPALAQSEVLRIPEDRAVRAAHYPALSPDGKTLCFSYLGDLWTVDAGGGVATRLTVHEAHDAYPRWSPDGSWIAFSSNRDSSFYDVYIVPSVGGEPRQLTHHSATDIVNDWSPDGKKLLFYSGRGTRGFEECLLDIETGVVKKLTQLEMPLRYASFSPDGNTIAFNQMPGPIPYWRPRYKGSGNADIYLLAVGTGKMTRLTNYDGMDLWPMYSRDGKTVFYVSDAVNGTPNIVRSPVSGGKPALVTRHEGDAVRFPSMARNGSLIVYEYNGGLWTVSPSGGTPRELKIFARSESKGNLIQRLNLTNTARELEISHDGKTLAFGLRGEIWTIPSDKGGDATRLTDNPSNDFDFTWSPDNNRIAFVSDRDGPYQVYLLDVKTRAATRLTTENYDDISPQWSPDGKTLAFLRSGPKGGLYTIPADGGDAVRIAASAGNNQFGVGISSYSWAPDGKWLAFSRRDSLDTRDVWVVPVAGGESVNVTRFPGDNVSPRWTADGKTLLFGSDRGPGASTQLYALPLEKPKDEDDEMAAMPAAAAMPKPAGDMAKKPVEVKIDFDEIHLRSKVLTSGTESVQVFEPTPDSKAIIFVRSGDFWSVSTNGGTLTRLTTTTDATGAARFTTDGSKFFYIASGGSLKSVGRNGGTPAVVAFSARMELDRRAEMAAAFNQLWRHLNTAFYDPAMHGVNWRDVRKRYEPLLPHISAKEDFAQMLSYMVGELNASHSEVTPAGVLTGGVATAHTGLEFDEEYRGPGLKVISVMPQGPTDREPKKVAVGEFVLAVDGTDVQYNEQFYKLLHDRAGRTVELLVNSKPEKEGARTLKIKPIASMELANLDYERRVKEARKKVDELSGGRLAYIHIRGMNQPALQRFERELFGDAQLKEGLVLDVRNNGGGNTHDNLLGPLSRAVYGYTQPRDAERSTQPVRHWNKPIILLTNSQSVSDAEIFPYGFKSLKLGKIVGTATPGYVIGTYDGQLVDGTSYRIPMWGWFTLDGKNMENDGIEPDILVENDPDQVRQGKDPQLERAVQELLKGVKSPPAASGAGGR